MELGAIAIKYDLTLNAFYFARGIESMEDNLYTLQREDVTANTIYIFEAEQEVLLRDNEDKLQYYKVGKYVIGVSKLDANGKATDYIY